MLRLPRHRLYFLERLEHLAVAPNDADAVLHDALELVLDLIGAVAVASSTRRRTLERSECETLGVRDRRRIHRHRTALARKLRRVLAGALAEHEQVRQRVAAKPIRAVQPGGAFAGGEQAGH